MCCPFSHRVTQLHIPVTEKYITQLNIHLDSSGTTCHIAPAALPASPWKSPMEA